MIHEVYIGKLCLICGTRERHKATRECVGCHHYRTRMNPKNIVGVDGRTENNKRLKSMKFEDENAAPDSSKPT